MSIEPNTVIRHTKRCYCAARACENTPGTNIALLQRVLDRRQEETGTTHNHSALDAGVQGVLRLVHVTVAIAVAGRHSFGVSERARMQLSLNGCFVGDEDGAWRGLDGEKKARFRNGGFVREISPVGNFGSLVLVSPIDSWGR